MDRAELESLSEKGQLERHGAQAWGRRGQVAGITGRV